MNLREFVYSVFSGFTRLYPKDYQQKYAEEMKSVFWDILEDSGDSGGWHAIRTLLREWLSLPACLFREYFSGNGESYMKTPRQIIGVTTMGFISLFILFAIKYGALYSFFLDFSRRQPPVFYWLSLVMDGILFGVLVGGSICVALSLKNKVAMMIFSGLAFAVAMFLVQPAYWEGLGISMLQRNGGLGSFFLHAASPILGLCIGLPIGLFWRGWKTGIVFGLASGLFFTLGSLTNRFFWPFLLDQGTLHFVSTKIMSAELWKFISWLINYSIYGGTVGFLWGVLLDRLPRLHLMNPASAG
jgi:hypothetical protein